MNHAATESVQVRVNGICADRLIPGPNPGTRLRHWSQLTASFRAVSFELFDIGPQIVDFGLILDAGENHECTWDHRLWILDVLFERLLVPGDSRVRVRRAVVESGCSTRFAAIEPIEQRADLVLRVRTYDVADQAFLERGLAGFQILRERYSC